MSNNLRKEIVEEIAAVLREAGKTLGENIDSQSLLEGGLGLDSLEFAVLVVRLEQKLGCDPFNSATLEKFPSTLSELVELYEKAGAAVVR